MTLSASHLRLAVPGKTLCHNLSLTLRPGQCWCVLGRNGSGKTTLLHALSGLVQPAAGAVWLDDRPLAQVPRRQAAQRIGVLLQEEAHVFWGTAKEYALLGRFPHAYGLQRLHAADQPLAMDALAQTAMDHAADQSFATLSGGERQRVRIAMVLAQAPDIYFLDEPLHALDLGHQLAVLRLFRQLATRQQKTIVMVLHDLLSASRFCDHALLLYDDGNVLTGDTSQLLTQANLETLYQCGMEEVVTTTGRFYIPGDAG